MDQYVIRKTGANGFEADKLMLADSTANNYALNKDIRYDIFDKVDIYTFFRSADGTISQENALQRTLSGVTLSAAAAVFLVLGSTF
jgi:hypothetical protein